MHPSIPISITHRCHRSQPQSEHDLTPLSKRIHRPLPPLLTSRTQIHLCPRPRTFRRRCLGALPIPDRNNDDGLSIKYADSSLVNYLVAGRAGVTGGESAHMCTAVVSARYRHHFNVISRDRIRGWHAWRLGCRCLKASPSVSPVRILPGMVDRHPPPAPPLMGPVPFPSRKPAYAHRYRLDPYLIPEHDRVSLHRTTRFYGTLKTILGPS
jgi:hypothetical protein